MKKIFKMSIHEIKQLRKSLTIASVTILLLTVAVILTKGNKDINLVILGFADLLEKLLIPLFVYIGIKGYVKSLNNTIQINQKRTEYFLAKSLSIIIISLIVAIIVTPLSYYFADLGKFDLGDFTMPLFLGTYNPVIPIIYDFNNMIIVTIISALIYSFISHFSLLSIILFNKIGNIKLFIIFITTLYTFNYLNTLLSTERNGADLIDRMLGFAGPSINLMVPIISLSIITLLLSMISYIVINHTEV